MSALELAEEIGVDLAPAAASSAAKLLRAGAYEGDVAALTKALQAGSRQRYSGLRTVESYAENSIRPIHDSVLLDNTTSFRAALRKDGTLRLHGPLLAPSDQLSEHLMAAGLARQMHFYPELEDAAYSSLSRRSES
jgi:hypothetical protein